MEKPKDPNAPNFEKIQLIKIARFL